MAGKSKKGGREKEGYAAGKAEASLRRQSPDREGQRGRCPHPDDGSRCHGANRLSCIHPITRQEDGLYGLAALAHGEGFEFLGRLLQEWEDGSNRFEQPGETLLGYFDRDLVAVGGLNVDPFLDELNH